MKKGSGSSSEKAKPLKYLHVTSVQGKLQLTMSGASNPHYQLCKAKAVLNPYWLLEVPSIVFHMWDTLLPNWKSKIQEWVFLETNATSQYDVQSLQGSSLWEILFSLSEHKAAASSLAASGIPSSPGCCCVPHNGKLQPETQMAQSKVTFSIDFCCVLFLHPWPNLWITAAKCIFVHGLYMSVLSCKLGMDDTGGRSGGQWHRDRRGAVCTCSSESFVCRLGSSDISQ